MHARGTPQPLPVCRGSDRRVAAAGASAVRGRLNGCAALPVATRMLRRSFRCGVGDGGARRARRELPECRGIVPKDPVRTPAMAAILPYLQSDTFQPDDIEAMSMALDDVCKELQLDGKASAKETVAVRIIDWRDAASVARQNCAIEFYARRTIATIA
jgi:hypothetical protein